MPVTAGVTLDQRRGLLLSSHGNPQETVPGQKKDGAQGPQKGQNCEDNLPGSGDGDAPAEGGPFLRGSVRRAIQECDARILLLGSAFPVSPGGALCQFFQRAQVLLDGRDDPEPLPVGLNPLRGLAVGLLLLLQNLLDLLLDPVDDGRPFLRRRGPGELAGLLFGLVREVDELLLREHPDIFHVHHLRDGLSCFERRLAVHVVRPRLRVVGDLEVSQVFDIFRVRLPGKVDLHGNRLRLLLGRVCHVDLQSHASLLREGGARQGGREAEEEKQEQSLHRAAPPGSNQVLTGAFFCGVRSRTFSPPSRIISSSFFRRSTLSLTSPTSVEVAATDWARASRLAPPSTFWKRDSSFWPMACTPAPAFCTSPAAMWAVSDAFCTSPAAVVATTAALCTVAAAVVAVAEADSTFAAALSTLAAAATTL